MFFPFVPVVSGIFTALALTGLVWYNRLSKEDRERADRLALDYARNYYSKGLRELTKEQLEHVHSMTKRHFS